MPKWKKDATEFTVSMSYHETRGAQLAPEDVAGARVIVAVLGGVDGGVVPDEEKTEAGAKVMGEAEEAVALGNHGELVSGTAKRTLGVARWTNAGVPAWTGKMTSSRWELARAAPLKVTAAAGRPWESSRIPVAWIHLPPPANSSEKSEALAAQVLLVVTSNSATKFVVLSPAIAGVAVEGGTTVTSRITFPAPV